MRVTCEENNPGVDIVKTSGEVVDPAETLIVATTDFFARRARFDRGSMRPAPGPALAAAPLVRDAAARWLTARGGRLRAADVADPPRWEPFAGGACLPD